MSMLDMFEKSNDNDSVLLMMLYSVPIVLI